jgi:OHCU decarboxylase
VSYQIYKNLAWLNDLPGDEARAVLLDCCGSPEWADRMTEARPFPTLERLFDKAEDIWFDLTTVDHLEAFAAHPQIGASKPAAVQAEQAADWSSGEQAGVKDAGAETHEQLAEINRLYHQKFGFIFIVCASGKTADEMLAIARARLRNSAETELRLAAEEQSKITAIRLGKLLEK